MDAISPDEAVKYLPLPVVIVTARKGERVNGMTAAWISQVSAEPPIVMVAIRSERYTWELMDDTEYFGISILGDGQKDIAEFFGTVSGRDKDKFEETDIEPFYSEEGIPLIPDSIAAFMCKKREVVEIGDHLTVFGEAKKGWKGCKKEPLLWYERGIIQMSGKNL